MASWTYAPGDPVLDALLSVLGHGSASHLAWNAGMLLAGIAILRRRGRARLAAGLFLLAPVGNAAFAHLYGASVHGASLGVFAVLGVVAVVHARARPAPTLALLAYLGAEQVGNARPVVVGHAVFFLVGVSVAVVAGRRREGGLAGRAFLSLLTDDDVAG